MATIIVISEKYILNVITYSKHLNNLDSGIMILLKQLTFFLAANNTFPSPAPHVLAQETPYIERG